MLKLHVKVKANANQNSIQAAENGTYLIRIKAAPIDGAANEAIIAYLAKLLGVAKGSIQILKGHTAPHKVIQMDVSEEVFRNALIRSN